MIKINQSFCKSVWNDVYIPLRKTKTSVSLHGQLNGINHHLSKTSPNPKHMDMNFINTNMTPREMILQTDYEFKCLKPTEKEMNVYRCIPKRSELDSYSTKFDKTVQLKKGDKMYMPEYAYATSNKSYAECYQGDSGIRFEIDIPENSQVSRIGMIGDKDEIVFPRFSIFECLGNTIEEAKNGVINVIKLRYLKPKY